ncbi:MAG: hypothetical protein IT368_00865 [Candidatus Hydrogenedentes bacterium]|nr:hypothetical protein [Candidatus Hydrogenedentota bacterium]
MRVTQIRWLGAALEECGWIALLAVLFAAWPASAQDTVVFDNPATYKVLTPHARWFQESGTPLTPAQAAERFATGASNTVDREWLELGFMNGTIWLAMTVRNDTADDHLVLEFRNPRISFVDLYIPNPAGGFDAQLNGAARPYQDRKVLHPMPVFPFNLKPGATATLILRVENLGDMRTRIWLWGADVFYNRVLSAYHLEMITIGSLLVLALFHFLVFLSLRDRGYLYLSCFILAWMLFYMAGNGTGHMLLWRDFTWLALRANTVFLILMLGSFVLFTLAFLESRKYTPRLYRVSLGFLGFFAVHLLFTLGTNSLARILINRYLVLATFILILVLLVAGIVRGSRMAVFFLASWVFLLAGSGLMLLLSWSLLSANWVIGSPIINILFTTSILLWSFELTGRVKGRMAEQRRLLKEQVRERTQELEKALSEVKTLSGLLPICASCKKIRDDTGYWNNVEHYVARHTHANFTHGICPECVEKLYPGMSTPRPGRRESGPDPGAAPLQ